MVLADAFLPCAFKQGNKPCTGRCPISVAVHRAKEGKGTFCFICQAAKRKTKYVIPPGTNRDPAAYRRTRNTRGARGGVQPKRESAWTEEAAKDRQIAALQKQVLENGGVLSPEEMSPTAAKLKYEKLKAQVAELQKDGHLVPDLVAALEALETTEAQALPTLRVLEGKMHDAENKALHASQGLVKCQEALQKATEKCASSEIASYEATTAYEEALAQKAAAKGWVRPNDMDTAEPILQQCPAHLVSTQIFFSKTAGRSPSPV